MFTFDPPAALTLAFVLLSLIVVGLDLALIGAAAGLERRRQWVGVGAVCAALWLAGHAAIAGSGLLEGGVPPRVMPYLALNVAVAVGLAASPVGRRLAALPLFYLVGLQLFRLPLEGLLHALYTAGQLPVQMTWSGRNLDVITALLAIPTALMARRGLDDRGVWIWNLMGSALLLNVVLIAVLSAPVPFRQFTQGPPVVLMFHAPWNWIVNVHVFTALVSHLVVFRALLERRYAKA